MRDGLSHKDIGKGGEKDILWGMVMSANMYDTKFFTDKKEEPNKKKEEGKEKPKGDHEKQITDKVSKGASPKFYEAVAKHFGEPEDDGESEAGLIKRIMSQPKDKVSAFLKDVMGKGK